MRQTVVLPMCVLMIVILFSGCVRAPVDDEAKTSPYVDQQFGAVRGLSQGEIDELRTGAGMGLARPAELNGYPGPLHVLELADQLDLDEAQHGAVQAIRQQMLDEAVPLGEEILSAYEALEVAFRAGEMEADELRMRLERLESLYTDLRFVHLVAHLETVAVLSDEQVRYYMELRGYQGDGDGVGDGDGAGDGASGPQGHDAHAGHGG